ncbi:hypothetical protein [Salisaeta longa]|uniref:hypothetical protein n=1 Tax=Salisaeta longa TaxID=503170 RepID=UPI0004087157|nr:hypothetical protein [Salisaeta longa]
MSNDARSAYIPRRASAAPGLSPKERLAATQPLSSGHAVTADDLSADMKVIERLVDRVADSGSAFQSVVVAAVQLLETVVCQQRAAVQAALSLGQRQKLQRMTDTTVAAIETLRNALRDQGGRAISLCPQQVVETAADQPWWFALSEALDTLEEGVQRMTVLASAQPPDSDARALSQAVADLMRMHHDALLIEAEQWIG